MYDYLYLPDDLEYRSSEVRDTVVALGLKMQAILLCRDNGMDHPLPDLKADFIQRRNLSLNLINELIPMPETLVSCHTFEVVDDGWGYYNTPKGLKEVFDLATFLSSYPEIEDREELRDYLEMQYEPYCEDDVSAEDILNMYDRLLGDDPDRELQLEFLDWVVKTAFDGKVKASALLPEFLYFLTSFAPGGYIRVVKSYIIEGLDLSDESFKNEIRELSDPLQSWVVEPILIQIGADAMLSFAVYSQDCYNLSEDLERPMWRLALKKIEDKLLSRGGNA